MNADVNIQLPLKNGHEAEDTQGINNTSTERHNGVDVTIASTNKKTTVKSPGNVTESCTEQLSENDTQGTSAATPTTTPNARKDRDVDSITSKVAKLAIKSGTWSCSRELCKAEDNVAMLLCGRCKEKRRYGCTNLPLYQTSLFVSKSYKKKYICENCVEIPDCLKEKCKPVVSYEDGAWERLQGELESKYAVINSMGVAQNTMFELSKHKDELISSQKALIDGMLKVDADINSTRKKLGDARDIIIHKDAELDKCKIEITKLSENSTSPDGHLGRKILYGVLP